jgi:cytoskeletal protein CcmA (bactofilin family)
MFAKARQRQDEIMNRSAAAEGRPMPSIIGPDMKVTGNLATPGEVHVDGEIEGDVACTKLTVGATGTIRGAISATSVRVHGRVAGSITADEVFLLSGASVNGDIVQISLEIAPGAEFEGAVRRSRKPAGAALAVTAVDVPVVSVAAAAAAEPAETTTLELTQEAPAPAASEPVEAEAKPAEAATADASAGEDRNRSYESRGQQQFRPRRDQHQRPPGIPNGAA